MHYSEEYRGRTIEVVRDDQFPVVAVKGGNAHLTVAQARRAIDHLRDRACLAHHGVKCGDSMRELREHGPYAGVRSQEVAA